MKFAETDHSLAKRYKNIAMFDGYDISVEYMGFGATKKHGLPFPSVVSLYDVSKISGEKLTKKDVKHLERVGFKPLYCYKLLKPFYSRKYGFESHKRGGKKYMRALNKTGNFMKKIHKGAERNIKEIKKIILTKDSIDRRN